MTEFVYEYLGGTAEAAASRFTVVIPMSRKDSETWGTPDLTDS